MNIIVGLGNPVPEYEHTRHNAGKLVVSGLAEIVKAKFERLSSVPVQVARVKGDVDTLFVLPTGYMNESGFSVQGVLQFFKEKPGGEGYTQLFVFYDDLDIALGESKLQYATGPKVHNGLNSVRTQLATDQFWHGRVGIDNRLGNREIPGKDYVLQAFNSEEQTLFSQKVFPSVVGQLQQKLAVQFGQYQS